MRLDGTHVFLEVESSEGAFFFVRYMTFRTGNERALAQEALDRMAFPDDLHVRAVHVFTEPPATFYARQRTKLEASERP